MTDARRELLGFAALFGMAAAGTSNLIVARAVPDLIPPVALGFWRWVAVVALLLPFCWPALRRYRADIKREWKKLAMLGGIGMGFSGMLPYVASRTTTPTNISLIYTITTIEIMLLAVTFLGERIRGVQALGIGLALLGVLVILFKGDIHALTRLEFVPGDLWALGSATLWALYSFLLRGFSSVLPPMVRIWCCAAVGMVVLLPMAVAEALISGPPAAERHHNRHSIVPGADPRPRHVRPARLRHEIARRGAQFAGLVPDATHGRPVRLAVSRRSGP